MDPNKGKEKIVQYLKKGSDFSVISDADRSVIMDKLNNIPRKLLCFASLNEVFKLI